MARPKLPSVLRARSARARKPAHHLRVEHLESRAVPATATVSGVVFQDKDQSGTKDGDNEVAVSGVKVYLVNQNNVIVDTDTTGGSGAYTLEAEWFSGEQVVRILMDVPNGYTAFGDTPVRGDLVVGPLKDYRLTDQEVKTQDIPLFKNVNVFGSVYIDEDGDGKLGERERFAPRGTVVYLDRNADGEFTAADDYSPFGHGASWDEVDDSGAYQLTGVGPGLILTGLIGPGQGGTYTQGMTNFENVPVSGEDIAHLRFGVFFGGTVKGKVFDDKDGDGTKDGDEPYVAGAVVEAVNAQFPQQPLATATTGADGRYEMHTPAGEFNVRLAPNPAFLQSRPADPFGYPVSMLPGGEEELGDIGRARGVVKVTSVKSTLAGVSVPGETCTVTVTVENKGLKVDLPGGSLLVTVYAAGGGRRVKIGEMTAQSRTILNRNQSMSFPVRNCQFPALGAADGPVPEGDFHYEAELGPGLGGEVGQDAGDPEHRYEFGDLGTRRGVVLAVEQNLAGAAISKYSMVGPGTGKAAFANGVLDLEFRGTTASSQPTAAVTGAGAAFVHDMTAPGEIGRVNMSGVVATGRLKFDAPLGYLGLRAFGGDPGDLTVGPAGPAGPGVPLDLKVTHFIRDKNISAAYGIQKISVPEWDDAGTTDTVTAPYVRSLSVTGDFDADLALTGTLPGSSYSLEGANVGNARGTWNVFGDIRSISAQSLAPDWQLLGPTRTRLGLVLVGDQLGGTIDVQAIGQLSAKEVAFTTIKAATDVTQITAQTLTNATIEAGGVVRTVSVNAWLGGSLTAAGAPAMTVAAKSGVGPGRMANVQLHLTGNSKLSTLRVAEEIAGVTIVMDQPTSGFGTITTKSWSGGSVRGGYVGVLNLTGAGTTLNGVTFDLPGRSPAGFSLHTLFTTGLVLDCLFTLGFNTARMTGGAFNGSKLTVGGSLGAFITRPGTGTGFDASSVTVGGHIGMVNLRDVSATGQTGLFVKAHSVGSYYRYAGGKLALPNGRPLLNLSNQSGIPQVRDSVGSYQLIIT